MREQIQRIIQEQVSFKGLEKVEAELLDHLEDSAESYIEEGYAKIEAIQMAILHFGDIKKFKKEISSINQKFKIIRFSMYTSLILLLFSISLTFKMSWILPSWMPDFNIFRVIKLISFSFLLTTLILVVFYKKNKQQQMV